MKYCLIKYLNDSEYYYYKDKVWSDEFDELKIKWYNKKIARIICKRFLKKETHSNEYYYILGFSQKTGIYVIYSC